MADSSRNALYLLAAFGTAEELKAALPKYWNDKNTIDMVKFDGWKRKYNPYGLIEHVGQTLLHVACVHGNPSCVELLLSLGASPVERTPIELEYIELDCHREHEMEYGWDTPMHLAGISGNGRVVELLRAAGGDIDGRSANQMTPLMSAADRSTRRRLRKLVAPTESIEYVLDHGEVVRQRKTESVWALIAAGADLNAVSGEFNRNYMHHKMTPHSRDVEKKDFHGRVTTGLTALHWAVNTGDHEVARCLIMAGADLEARTGADSFCDQDQTPLHFAVEFLDVKMVELLLIGGADVNAKDALGNSALRKVFAVSDDTYKRWCHWRDLELLETIEEVKADRLALTKMLIHASTKENIKADFGAYVHKVTYEKEPPKKEEYKSWRNRRHRHYYHPFEDTHCHYRSQPEPVLDSGAVAVLDLITVLDVNPHSLQSMCRWTIRKALTRPILLDGNVSTLPLPVKLRNYVAMVVLDTKDTVLDMVQDAKEQ